MEDEDHLMPTGPCDTDCAQDHDDHHHFEPTTKTSNDTAKIVDVAARKSHRRDLKSSRDAAHCSEIVTTHTKAMDVDAYDEEVPVGRRMAMSQSYDFSADRSPPATTRRRASSLIKRSKKWARKRTGSLKSRRLSTEIEHNHVPLKERECAEVDEESEEPIVIETDVGLPEEVVYKIFLYLGAKELATVAQICRCWHRIADDDNLWAELYHKDESTEIDDADLDFFDSWKLRYRAQNCKGLFPVGAPKNRSEKVSFTLSSDTVYCSETNVLTGEIHITVTKPIKTSGIFIHILGREHWFNVAKVFLNQYVSVVGDKEWYNHKKQVIPFAVGQYRIPFRYKFPSIGKYGYPLPQSLRAVYAHHELRVNYKMCVVMTRHFPLQNISSGYRSIDMLPFSPMRLQTLQSSLSQLTPVVLTQRKEYLLNGYVLIRAKIPRRIWKLGETLKIQLNVDNSTAKHSITRITISIIEHLCETTLKYEVDTHLSVPKGTRQKLSYRFTVPCHIGPTLSGNSSIGYLQQKHNYFVNIQPHVHAPHYIPALASQVTIVDAHEAASPSNN